MGWLGDGVVLFSEINEGPSCVATTLLIVQNWIQPPDRSARRRALKHMSATSRDTILAMAQAYRRPSLEHSLTRSLMGGLRSMDYFEGQIPAQSDQSIKRLSPPQQHGGDAPTSERAYGYKNGRSGVVCRSFAD